VSEKTIIVNVLIVLAILIAFIVGIVLLAQGDHCELWLSEDSKYEEGDWRCVECTADCKDNPMICKGVKYNACECFRLDMPGLDCLSESTGSDVMRGIGVILLLASIVGATIYIIYIYRKRDAIIAVFNGTAVS